MSTYYIVHIYKIQTQVWRGSSVVEKFPSKHEILGLSPNVGKTSIL